MIYKSYNSTSTFFGMEKYRKEYDKLRRRYTIIVLYHIRDLPYDLLYTTSRSFEPHDIRYDTTLCECRVAGVYFLGIAAV
jgi:hypothetical protein